MADTKTKIILSASDETRAAFESAKRNIGSLEAPLLSMRNALNAVATSAVVTTISAFGKAIINAAEEAEQAQLKLQAVYKATGGAVGFTTGELNRMADAMAEVTHFDDESIRNGMSEIIRFGNITGAVFKDSLGVIADYAAFSGQEFPAAASAVAQALAGPESAAKLLKTAGVILTEQEKDLIKSLKDAGDEAGAQQVILERLQGTYSGMEETLNSGLTGATKSLGKEWGDLLETLGKTGHATEVADHVLGGMAAAIHRVRESIDDADTHYQNSVLFNKGKGAALQLSAPGAGDTGPLAGKTIADVQAVNAAIAATQKAADNAAAAKFVERMKKQAAAAEKANQALVDRYIKWDEEEFARQEKQTFDLVNKQQERFAALSEAAEEAAASDLERAELQEQRQLADLERQRMIMATDHALTLGEIQSFETAKLNIKKRAQAQKEQMGKAAFIQDLATLGKESAVFMTLYKVAAAAEIMAAGGVRAEKSAAWAATWGGPPAAAAAFAISWAATLANAAMVSGLAGTGGGGGGGAGSTGSVPMPESPLPYTIDAKAPKPGIIVSVNLGDDDMPGANYVRKFIGLLNEQIRDGVTIDQIRVN